MAAKKTKGKRKRGGSMSGMRSGFRGLLGGKKRSKKSDPKEFMVILGVLFVIGVVFFLMSGQ
jgi:hypothetical protein